MSGVIVLVGIVYILYMCFSERYKRFETEYVERGDRERIACNRLEFQRQLCDIKTEYDIVRFGYGVFSDQYERKLENFIGIKSTYYFEYTNPALYYSLCLMDFGLVSERLCANGVHGFARTKQDYMTTNGTVKDNKEVERVVKFIYEEMELNRFGDLLWRSDGTDFVVRDVYKDGIPYTQAGEFYLSCFAYSKDYLPK